MTQEQKPVKETAEVKRLEARIKQLEKIISKGGSGQELVKELREEIKSLREEISELKAAKAEKPPRNKSDDEEEGSIFD